MLLRGGARLAVVALALGAAVIGSPGGSEAGEPAESGTFLALTYNVAGLPEGLSGSNPSVNTPLISPLLNDYDLVLVQEDWVDPVPPIPGIDFFHDDLIAEATHPYLSTPAPPPQGTDPRRPSALVADGLNRLSRFPFGPITRQMWPNCFGSADQSDGGAADCLSQKGFEFARTAFAPGISVDIYNLHGEAGSTPLDEQYSAEDFAALGDFIVANSAGRAVLVGGDYNLHTDRPVDGAVFDAFLAETGLTDVCERVDCGADSDQIDRFVFRSGGGVTLEPLDHQFEREKFTRADGEPLSDHDALSVTFRWTRQVPGVVRGSVEDADGAPLAGVQVSAYGAGDTWTGSSDTTTGADGSYELEDVVPGGSRILFRPSSTSGLVGEWFDNSPTRGEAVELAVAEGGSIDDVDAVLAEGGALSGAVTNPVGAPVEGVQVWLYSAIDTWVGSAATTTGADGSYVLRGVRPGEYRLRFVAPVASGLRSEWFDDSRKRATAREIAIARGPAVDGVNARLDP